MTNYTLRFQETYESFFDVEAESFEEAKTVFYDKNARIIRFST